MRKYRDTTGTPVRRQAESVGFPVSLGPLEGLAPARRPGRGHRARRFDTRPVPILHSRRWRPTGPSVPCRCMLETAPPTDPIVVERRELRPAALLVAVALGVAADIGGRGDPANLVLAVT